MSAPQIHIQNFLKNLEFKDDVIEAMKEAEIMDSYSKKYNNFAEFLAELELEDMYEK